MSRFVHLAPAAAARRILRSGVAARSRGWFGESGVYCTPVSGSFTITHQWVREMRRWHPGVLVAMDLRIADDEPVTVGRYGKEPRRVTAAQAVAVVREVDDPRGYQVFVPRAIRVEEVRRARNIPQGIGWRYLPDAHGRRPCACPVCLGRGQFGAARVRRRFSLDEPRRTKPELMAGLRAATDPDDVIDALAELGRRSRGGAEELAYLVDHPDPEVREALGEALERYRGRAGRMLREQLRAGTA